MVRELKPSEWPFATDEERARGWQEPRFDRRKRGDRRSGSSESEAAGLDVERLEDAMRESYTYEDRDNGVPSLPFIDDIEAFWEPFAKKVAARLTEAKPESPA